MNTKTPTEVGALLIAETEEGEACPWCDWPIDERGVETIDGEEVCCDCADDYHDDAESEAR